MAATEAQQGPGYGEQEPLLGRVGDVSQTSEDSLLRNLVTGTAVVAQAGVWVLAAIVWGAVFSNDLMLFSVHPLLNSAAILFYVQAILILQPTHAKSQKVTGTYYHSALNTLATLLAIGGLVVIEYNKFAHNGTHFVSTHAILGLTTYIVIVLQVLVGAAQFYTPGLLGGESNAKALYKYHRASGYVALLLMLATVTAATFTTFNVNVLGIQLWAVVVSGVLVVLGVGARVKKAKFGL